MIRVYLDQNKWIELARTAHGKVTASDLSATLEVARYGVEHGLVSFPLSAVHYMETYRRADGDARQRLGAVMAELSRFHTIGPPEAIVPAEIDRALQERYGRPESPRPLRVFGVGVGHAFNEPDLKYKLPTDAAVPSGYRSIFEEAATRFLERHVIAGPPKGMPIPGMVENDGYRSFGERYAEGERKLAQQLDELDPTGERRPEWLAADEIIDVLNALNEAFERAHISKGESRDLETAEGLSALLRDLPSRHVVYELRRIRHEDSNFKWKPNDLEDISALGVAIAYCDVVVTERHWRHVAYRAELDGRYSTAVLSDLRQLPAAIAA